MRREETGEEAEEIVQEDYPVREVVLKAGINEDGGGVEISVRFDGEEPEKVIEAVEKLLNLIEAKFNGRHLRKREKEREVV
ncbi:hypothetical protein Ferp_2040 [Ferroglobus placidus DSM 10642]|uniref:Uncharacterized protein n=1 Tax=Ferroglobus placidus (strain DSM 10642 / AEDII12DO) TaxID=589924 RepID=D3S0B2_FERPA|nr:hypothetical protein [Ferroglobus placidus]ADC66175.1 hypothetical protein Ferp_2040 [Ferroglobus placidus DSM 10642]